MFLTQQPFEEHQTERDVQLKQSGIRLTITIKNKNNVNYNILILIFFSKYHINYPIQVYNNYITYHVKRISIPSTYEYKQNKNMYNNKRCSYHSGVHQSFGHELSQKFKFGLDLVNDCGLSVPGQRCREQATGGIAIKGFLILP